jgi:hypothetical protein
VVFCEVTTSFSLLAFSLPHHQKSYVALHGTTYETAECTNVLARVETQTTPIDKDCGMDFFLRLTQPAHLATGSQESWNFATQLLCSLRIHRNSQLGLATEPGSAR